MSAVIQKPVGRSGWLTRLLLVGATAVALAVPAVVLSAGPASAATSTGCSGGATSVNRNGEDIGQASAPGQGATESDPLKIDSNGSIAYHGSSDSVIQHGSWDVDIYGLNTIRGKIKNDSGTTTTSGVQEVGKYLHFSFGPFDTVITGKYHVHFTATGEGGAKCTVDAYIYLIDSPLRTPFFYAAVLLLLLAFLLLVFFGRPEALLDILEGDYDSAAGEVMDGIL